MEKFFRIAYSDEQNKIRSTIVRVVDKEDNEIDEDIKNTLRKYHSMFNILEQVDITQAMEEHNK